MLPYYIKFDGADTPPGIHAQFRHQQEWGFIEPLIPEEVRSGYVRILDKIFIWPDKGALQGFVDLFDFHAGSLDDDIGIIQKLEFLDEYGHTLDEALSTIEDVFIYRGDIAEYVEEYYLDELGVSDAVDGILLRHIDWEGVAQEHMEDFYEIEPDVWVVNAYAF